MSRRHKQERDRAVKEAASQCGLEEHLWELVTHNGTGLMCEDNGRIERIMGGVRGFMGGLRMCEDS